MMEAIHSSETSVLTRATFWTVSRRVAFVLNVSFHIPVTGYFQNGISLRSIQDPLETGLTELGESPYIPTTISFLRNIQLTSISIQLKFISEDTTADDEGTCRKGHVH
jgi:hypothetical protein